jgi:hypothetical protein
MQKLTPAENSFVEKLIELCPDNSFSYYYTNAMTSESSNEYFIFFPDSKGNPLEREI